MNESIRQALAKGHTIDMTTVGRETGQPRRHEMWFNNIDGTVYITGTPGKRDWYANMLAHPDFTFHLKQDVTADLPARATPVTDPATRRAIFQRILSNLGHSEDLEKWLDGSPLVSVTFPES